MPSFLSILSLLLFISALGLDDIAHLLRPVLNVWLLSKRSDVRMAFAVIILDVLETGDVLLIHNCAKPAV